MFDCRIHSNAAAYEIEAVLHVLPVIVIWFTSCFYNLTSFEMLHRQAGICSQLQPEVEELKARLRAEGLKCRGSKKELLVKRLLSKASEPQESRQEAAPSGKGSSEAPQRQHRKLQLT